MKQSTMLFTCVAVLILCIGGCKKDDNPTQSNTTTTTTGSCNFTTDVIAVEGATKNIIKPFCHVLGSTYFAEFLVDTSAAPTGVAILFDGAATPAVGDYSIVTQVSQVAAGKVYVEYYDPANAWDGTTGTVKVTKSGTQTVVSFCSLDLYNTPSSKKTVSVRATCNL
jgi:hypothetical protein